MAILTSTSTIKSSSTSTSTIKGSSTIKSTRMGGGVMDIAIVNGTVVVKDSKVLKGVYPGQPIRLPDQSTD